MKNTKLNRTELISIAGVIVGAIGAIAAILALVTPEFRKCLGLEKGTCPITSSPKETPSPDEETPSPKRKEIPSSNWQKIPGTHVKSEENAAQDAHDDSIYINKTISRSGNIIIFEVFNPFQGETYVRVQGDCEDMNWKNLSTGNFESSNRIAFTPAQENWQTKINETQNDILIYACKLSKK
jgi:hypothetical protein